MPSGTFYLQRHPMQIVTEENIVRAATDILVDDLAQSDADLVARAKRRDPEAFRFIMKRHNQRLYRLARGVVRDDAEAEDIVQEAYLRAFSHLDGFRGEASLATWLSRITINEALGRLRKRRRRREAIAPAQSVGDGQVVPFPLNAASDDPERTMAQRQILHLVEQATDNLPEVYRRPLSGGDGRPARPARSHCEDQAAPRQGALAQGARCADRPDPARRLPVRRPSL